MKITLNQKRFLITWVLFHSFALFVNLADIRAELPNGANAGTFCLFTSGYAYGHKDDFWPFTKFYKTDPIWEEDNSGFTMPIDTTKAAGPQTVEEKEEATYLEKLSKQTPSEPVAPPSRHYRQVGEQNYYGGLFNSYGIPEYIFYMFLGAGIVFVPKLWKP